MEVYWAVEGAVVEGDMRGESGASVEDDIERAVAGENRRRYI